jgi:hypothetical protein
VKAILLHQHGGPDALEYADFPTPEPKPGEVLIRLRAAALNRLDIWVREGWPGIWLDYQHNLGSTTVTLSDYHALRRPTTPGTWRANGQDYVGNWGVEIRK